MFRLMAILVVLYIAGFIVFVMNLPVPMPHTHPAQGIVALTGGDERLAAAVNLLETHQGLRLLVSGVHQTTTKAELKRLSHGGARFDCCADMGYAAENTRGNAEEAAAWARTHRFKSLIVVTARYHMPRSLTEFQAAILLAQMKRIEPHMARRAAAAAILDQELSQIPGLRLLKNDPRNTRRTYHLYCFWFDPEVWEISRDQFVDALNAEGIPASCGYLTPVYSNLCFQPGDNAADKSTIRRPLKGSDLDFSRTRCPVAEEACKNIVWLTQSTLLADEDCIRMSALAIWKIYRSRIDLQKKKLAEVH